MSMNAIRATEPRFVKKGFYALSKINEPNQCPACGSFACSGHVTQCLACGTTQCMGNGLARGQCSICCIGLLPGWCGNNHAVCGRAKCTAKGVAVHHNKMVCIDHAPKEKIAQALADRIKSWEVYPKV